MNKITTKNLLERFSCFLIGRGKKASGHKMLLESLLMLREKHEKKMLYFTLQKDIFENLEKLTNQSAKKLKKNKVEHKKELAANFAFPEGRFYLNLKKQNQIDSYNEDNISLNPNQGKDKNKTSLFSLLRKEMHDKRLPINKTNDQKPMLLGTSFPHAFSSGESTGKHENARQTVLQKSLFEKRVNKSICKLCIDNVKPILETRKVRKGRITYRVPKISGLQRQEGKAIALLIENARSHKANLSKRSTATPFSSPSSDLSAFNKKQQFNNKAEQLSVNPSRAACSNVSSPKLQNKVKQTETMNRKGLGFKEETGNKENKQWLLPILENQTMKNKYFPFFREGLQKKSMKSCLSQELLASGNGKGETIEKKQQLHQEALQNRANLHFRWW